MISSGLLPKGLTREEVIRLTGSAARMEYRPADPTEAARYHYGQEQKAIEATTRRDFHVIVGLFLCGLSAQAVGNSYCITRQAVEKRLRVLPDEVGTMRRALVLKSAQMPEVSSMPQKMTAADAGRIGGPKRMAALTPEQRRQLAQAAARARWGKSPERSRS
jgi:hypothetical protein